MSQLSLTNHPMSWNWKADPKSLTSETEKVRHLLLELDKPVYLSGSAEKLGATQQVSKEGQEVVAFAQALLPENLGDPAFRQDHGVRYAYHGGAMANAIASEALVISLAKQGFLCSFGAAGLVPDRVEAAIKRIQEALPNGPYAFNLIHAPAEEALERGAVERFLKFGVRTVEASAFLGLTEHIVLYRVAGLSRNGDGSVNIANKVIAKISRTETARKFMEPAPEKLVAKLLASGKITAEQAELAKLVPMADDITAEADSGGHTDNRPFVTLIPSILALRDEVQRERNYPNALRVGGGGGIGTPEAALAAFAMGVSYVVVGSINQACLESGASEHTRKLLALADMADVTMAPAADMFEMGVKLQVLKRGTMFPMRAHKLYELYTAYDSIDAIPAEERKKLEEQVFRAPLEEIWTGTVAFFKERDPEMLERAMGNPKRKMALIFRWYLGLSSRWSNIGEKGREMDYQIWAGPSLGAFNAWVKGTYLENFEQRRAADVALHVLRGAAYLTRLHQLRLQGVLIPAELAKYTPSSPASS
jgi:PfaD family protein